MSKVGTKNVLVRYFWARISKKLLPQLKSAPSNLSNCKILKKKQKKHKFGTKNVLLRYFWLKMSYLGIFRLELEKKCCHIWNQRPWICLAVKFGAKIKILKFETKMPDLGIFGLEFEHDIVIFEVGALVFA